MSAEYNSQRKRKAVSDDGTQWDVTETKIVKCSDTWTVPISNSDSRNYYVGEQVTSPSFYTQGNDDDDIRWCIVLYPKGKCTEDSGFVSLHLCLRSSNINEITVNKLQFSVIDSNNVKQHVWSTQKPCIFYPQDYDDYEGIGCSKFVSEEFLKSQDRLTINCTFFVLGDQINTNGLEDTPQLKRRCVLDDFGKLLEDMSLSDVTLVAGGKEIRAHKAILATRSVVFAAMFEHDMQERKLSRVEITDVDHDVLKEMLSYMYTDRTPNLDKMAADLLGAADKYALNSLKLLCEEAVSKSLSIETAAEALVLADLHSAALLKKHTITFINSGHGTMVMQTEGWKKATSTHPQFVYELCRAACLQIEE